MIDVTPSSLNNVPVPEIVKAAYSLARTLGFAVEARVVAPGKPAISSACIPEMGRLLRVLAACKPGGLIGELGTGPGVGSAWLASGMTWDARLISVEVDPTLASSAARLFSDCPFKVEIRNGDWRTALPRNVQFDLLFADAPLFEEWERIIDMVGVGGQIIFDDLTPFEYWPEEWLGLPDRKREFAFGNARLIGTEIRTTPRTSALIMARIR